MASPNPFINPELWETLILVGPKGRVTVPGVVNVDVEPGAPEVDEVSVPGQEGVRALELGWRAGKATVRVEVIDAEEFSKLRAVLDLYRRRKGDPIQPLNALHPNLSLHGLKDVYIASIRAPDYSREGYSLEIELREYFPEYAQARVNVGQIGTESSPSSSGDGTDPRKPGAQPTAKQAQKNPPSSYFEKQFQAGFNFAQQITGGR
ncbi:MULTISPECIES: hypothetical protein [unclassified Meiothermus]|uniref:hypothetical protein n=1 Tax=unclassified Meiothermus TaxID=370471 RepID=UPI000D7BCA71|nr:MULTISPECIES: hypothetical protein [unclassified Meiothermus]PZA07757.1 hypothetical protein DNA98_05475 [Meiothermus sp. Pnk-1]RYM38943.1 hypothetical protein EWH23_04220 [Meiothermus sp. PNK-Is4]